MVRRFALKFFKNYVAVLPGQFSPLLRLRGQIRSFKSQGWFWELESAESVRILRDGEYVSIVTIATVFWSDSPGIMSVDLCVDGRCVGSLDATVLSSSKSLELKRIFLVGGDANTLRLPKGSVIGFRVFNNTRGTIMVCLKDLIFCRSSEA